MQTSLPISRLPLRLSWGYKIDSYRPIGIFDSGIGGLTVANAIRHFLPEEQLIYFGDLAHLPYGEKSADAIRFYCLKISQFLLQQNCKMIVIACNSAATAAYDMLLDFYEGKVVFVNVVDPLVEAVRQSDSQRVGVIATKATIASDVYRQKIQKANPSITVSQVATPLLVPMIEEGYYRNRVSRVIIQQYLADDRLQDIDTLLLACTHYPLIKGEIIESLPATTIVLDSTNVVTYAVQKALAQEQLLNTKRQAEDKFYVSDYTESFAETARLFYGHDVDLQVQNIW